MTLTRAFEKLRDAGVIVPLAPRPLPHPIPPHFRSHEPLHCSALHHAIQDLIDSGVVDLARPSVTTNPLPAHSTHAVPPPPGLGSVDMGTSFCSDLAQSTFHFDYGRHQSRSRSVDIHTLFLLIRCDHSFTITFRVGTPRSGTHDIFYALHIMHEGFLSFLSPYYLGLRYVPCLKTTLRPLLHIVFDSSHVVTSGGLQGIATSFTFIEPGFLFIWIMLRSVVDSDALLYTGAYPSFGGRSDWFLTLEHLTSDMEIIGLFHVVLIAYWGIATLLEVLTSDLTSCL
ncbi:hypothetical protein AAG906_006171 [Vitis piasezkii]